MTDTFAPPPPRKPSSGAKWLLLALAPFGLCCMTFWTPGALNDLAAWRLQQAMLHPLPPNTRVLWSHYEVGLLGGNGNHCDFEARAELATSGDGEAARRAYATRRVPLPWGVEDDMGNLPATIAVGPLTAPDAGGDVHFQISVGLYGGPPGWDYRCH